MLREHGIAISMDAKGAWRHNVFVERFWRSLKYEEVYLRAYESASEAKHFIGRYVVFYNEHRPHSALDGRNTGRSILQSADRKGGIIGEVIT